MIEREMARIRLILSTSSYLQWWWIASGTPFQWLQIIRWLSHPLYSLCCLDRIFEPCFPFVSLALLLLCLPPIDRRPQEYGSSICLWRVNARGVCVCDIKSRRLLFLLFFESSSGKKKWRVQRLVLYGVETVRNEEKDSRGSAYHFIYLLLYHPTWASQLLTGRNDSRGKVNLAFLCVYVFLILFFRFFEYLRNFYRYVFLLTLWPKSRVFRLKW